MTPFNREDFNTIFDQLPEEESPFAPEPEEDEEDQYWALGKGSDLVSAIADKESAFYSALERMGFLAIWRMQFSQYYGQMLGSVGGVLGSHTITQAGEDGEQLIFRLNEARSIITQQINLTIGERASFQSVATNDDHDATSQVEACDQLIEYSYREAHGERREREVFEADSNFGLAYGWVRWDREAGDVVSYDDEIPADPQDPSMGMVQTPQSGPSGAPKVGVVYPWECPREVSAKDHLWSVVRERRSKWELAAQWPEYAEKLRAMDGLDEHTTEALFGMSDGMTDTDDVIVRHFYHTRCAAVPEGRYAIICGDLVLSDMPLPVSKGLPLVEMCSEKYIGTSFGYANAWMLNPANQMIDQLLSDTASNLATYGRQVIAIPEGTTFDINALANGHRALKIPVGSEMPQPLLFAAMPEPVKWVIDLLLRRMEALSGMNGVTRGDPQANISSGTMAALFHEIAYEYMGARQVARDFYREGMANLMLDMMRTHGKSAFIAQVVGKSDRPYLKQFHATDIAGVRKVIVKTRNPMLSNTQGRLEVFNAVKAIANPQDRAAAIDLILTGNADKFTDYDQTETQAIDWENEQLANGVAVQVVAFDDHKRHYREHKATFNKSRAEMVVDDPNISQEEFVRRTLARKAMLNHLQAHHEAYMTMSPIFAEWNEMMPPPMARGMGGPPAQQPNLAPVGAMGGDGAGTAPSGGAAMAARGATPPTKNSGAGVPEAAEAAQAPGGPATDQGDMG